MPERAMVARSMMVGDANFKLAALQRLQEQAEEQRKMGGKQLQVHPAYAPSHNPVSVFEKTPFEKTPAYFNQLGQPTSPYYFFKLQSPNHLRFEDLPQPQQEKPNEAQENTNTAIVKIHDSKPVSLSFHPNIEYGLGDFDMEYQDPIDERKLSRTKFTWNGLGKDLKDMWQSEAVQEYLHTHVGS